MTIIHDVQQGTPEWHALRNRVKHTASELPAIRGNSKYKTRAQAIREAATGIKPEVSEFQQRKFDEGHATEAAARAIVEEMLGEDLFPATATTDDEYLLASSDGGTMLGEKGFEHKLWNEEIAAQIRSGKLHPMYTDQMDQIIAVFGYEVIIFVTSDGTKDKFEWLGYTGNPESIARIRADWEQFDKDVAAYVPEVEESKPILTARPIENLPALVIEVTGRVTHSNLVEFKQAAVAVISSIKTELVTDQDFVDAQEAVTYLENVEESAKHAKQHALNQTESIAALHRTLDEVIKMASDVRKKLSKTIDSEKQLRKEQLIQKYQQQLHAHRQQLAERAPYMPHVLAADFAGALKQMRSLKAMEDKLKAVLANAMVEASAIADRIEKNIKALTPDGQDWRFLFPDLHAVANKPCEDFANLLDARVAKHKEMEAARTAEIQRQAEEAARRKVAQEQAESARKAQEAEAQAKAKAETPAVTLSEVVHAVAPAAVAEAVAPSAPSSPRVVAKEAEPLKPYRRIIELLEDMSEDDLMEVLAFCEALSTKQPIAA